jgi:hypothetical protein
MKCCPKCVSTEITFPAFYRPSIWKCLDCGYEGAFIVENGKLPEKMQGCHIEKDNIVDLTEGEICVNSIDIPVDDSLKSDFDT